MPDKCDDCVILVTWLNSVNAVQAEDHVTSILQCTTESVWPNPPLHLFFPVLYVLYKHSVQMAAPDFKKVSYFYFILLLFYQKAAAVD